MVRNDLAGVEEYYLKVLAIDEELAASGAPKALEDLVEVYQGLAGIYEARGDLTLAKKYTQKAEKIREKH